LDYGIWPDPGIDYVTLSDIDRTIMRATQLRSNVDALAEALNRLRAERLAAEYIRDDGTQLRIEHMVVDAGYKSEVVYRFAQTHQHVTPSHGKGVTARSRPWSMEKRKAGERIGYGWRLPPTKGTRAPRYCLIDTNTWKTQMAECWSQDLGTPGAWSLYRAAPQRHRMFGDNCSAEYPTKTAGHGRELFEWAVRPNRDNHLYDAMIYAAVAGSMLGVRVPGESERVTVRRRVSMQRDNTASASPSTPANAIAVDPVLPELDQTPTAKRRTMSEMRAARRAAATT
jgi:phage terminase large subunit GpA-like protein